MDDWKAISEIAAYIYRPAIIRENNNGIQIPDKISGWNFLGYGLTEEQAIESAQEYYESQFGFPIINLIGK